MGELSPDGDGDELSPDGDQEGDTSDSVEELDGETEDDREWFLRGQQ